MRIHKLKSSQNKKDSYPVFSVFFSAASNKKNTKYGAAVTSLKGPSYFLTTLDIIQILRGYQGCVNTKYIVALYVISNNKYLLP